MTPSYAELTAAIRQEGEAIATAGRQDLDVQVKTCGEWTVRDLLAHVGSVYHRAATVVSERATAAVAWEPPPSELGDPVGYLEDALDEVVHAFSSSEPDAPAWNWSGSDQTAAFWARRMAHESTVHRYDAQRAFGLAQPIDADLAHDGLDELVDLVLPRIVDRDGPDLPESTVTLVATDEGEWPLRLGPAGVERLGIGGAADVTVTGTASALLLAAYGRVRWTSLEIAGDASLLDTWSSALRF